MFSALILTAAVQFMEPTIPARMGNCSLNSEMTPCMWSFNSEDGVSTVAIGLSSDAILVVGGEIIASDTFRVDAVTTGGNVAHGDNVTGVCRLETTNRPYRIECRFRLVNSKEYHLVVLP